MQESTDVFGARAQLEYAGGTATYYRLAALSGLGDIDRLPMTVKVLLENVLRNCGQEGFEPSHVETLAGWTPGKHADTELPYLPARVLLQDYTGVPSIVDFAAMRSAMQRLGGDPARVNPLLPADLVVDHSVQVDVFGAANAFAMNVEHEYKRNRERYGLLKWAQQAFDGLTIVPPGAGICHQVNLEYLSKVVQAREVNGQTVAFPDTCVGTDSHTPMVNGLGVLAWGVGGIEAEGAMLGQPIYMLPPKVVGMRFVGRMPEGATATDLVLTVTQKLREYGVVGRFVEYFGPGLSNLPVADRATIGNMSPEYGATAGLFPVDDETLRYMRLTGRSEEQIDLVEKYCKAQGMFRTDDSPEPEFDELLELDLGTVTPSVAGPRRPQDRVGLSEVSWALRDTFTPLHAIQQKNGEAANTAAVADTFPASDPLPAQDEHPGGLPNDEQGLGQRHSSPERPVEGEEVPGFASSPSEIVKIPDNGFAAGPDANDVRYGSVVISAITSCTNTSNPSVMLAAGLLAKKAVERGLQVKPFVKTSLAPGSRAVADYYENAGLTPYLQQLGYHIVGFGCTTCIGNSGPLIPEVAEKVDEEDLVVAAVLSGNRNFEGRIHPQVRASFLASPPLVIAYALAGTVDIDLSTDPLGRDSDGELVYLRDIWPSEKEVGDAVASAVTSDVFSRNYAHVHEGDEFWQSLEVTPGQIYDWNDESTYIQEPPFFEDIQPEPPATKDIENARVLVKVGDSITTDHISPAGTIAPKSPAGEYLILNDVRLMDFNSYGARRGNHEVMMRGTFANIRLRNELAPGTEGWWTSYFAGSTGAGEQMSIYEASDRYRVDGTPLLIIAGKEYGSGSSRDWAAKGPKLLGVEAVIAESYERIHRSNLVMMGILPLQFKEGESAETLGLSGIESFSIQGIAGGLTPGQELTVEATHPGGRVITFGVTARIDTPVEWDYYRHGGILHMVLRRLATA